MLNNVGYSASVFDDFEIIDTNIKNIGFDNLSKYITNGNDSITFILIEKGSGKLNIDLVEHNIETKTLLAVLPGYMYSNFRFSEDITFKLFSFESDTSSKLSLLTGINLFENVYSYPCVQLSVKQFHSLLNYFSFIIEQNSWEDRPHRKTLIKTLLSSFLIQIASIYTMHMDDSIGINRNKELFIQFNNLLFENIKKERTVQFYADKMYLSSKYLSLIIKEVSGRTMTAWIREWTISTIKIMLKTSDLTVAQISEELDFPNPSFMGRYFKQYTRMTPLQYRYS